MNQSINDDKVTVRAHQSKSTTSRAKIMQTPGNSAELSAYRQRKERMDLRKNQLLQNRTRTTFCDNTANSKKSKLVNSDVVSKVEASGQKDSKMVSNLNTSKLKEGHSDSNLNDSWINPSPKPLHPVNSDTVLKQRLSRVEEKFSSASEELQAAEEELTELRIALNAARRSIDALKADNEVYKEQIKSLSAKLHQISTSNVKAAVSRLTRNSQSPEAINGINCEDQIHLLDEQIRQLYDDKKDLELILQSKQAENARLKGENDQIKMAFESERAEWDQMQRDLLVAVKVANEFKIEAQVQIRDLSMRVNELQKRRSTISLGLSPKVNSVAAGGDEKQRSWEEAAWQILMLQSGGSVRGSRRNALLRWCQHSIVNFPDIEITNFSTSWTDGKALCYLLAAFHPEKIDLNTIFTKEPNECIEEALTVARSIGVKVEVTVNDFVAEDRPPWSLIMKYILNLYYVISNGTINDTKLFASSLTEC